MKQCPWMLIGLLSVFAQISSAAAQEPSANSTQASVFSMPLLDRLFPGKRPCPCPPGEQLVAPVAPKTPPVAPTTPPNAPPAPQAAAQPAPSEDLLAGESESKSVQGTNTVVAAGKGLGSAVFDPNATFSKTAVLTPLILPGMFTAATPQSAMPVDQVFFNYGNFGSVACVLNRPVFKPSVYTFTPQEFTTFTPSSVSQNRSTQAGFNLSSFNIGVEKTFLDGLGSVYVSVPLLYAADNVTGQQIDGLGDISAGIKVALFRSQTGSVLTAGLTVTTPTGHAAEATSFKENAEGTALIPSGLTTINPTFIQPWLAGLWIKDRFFIQEYIAVVVPTDDRLANFINNDLSTGYTIYQSPQGILTSVTPIFAAQALLPLSNVGTPTSGTTSQFSANVPLIGNEIPTIPAAQSPAAFYYPDQLILTGGLQIGLWNRALFSAGVVVPVVGPNAFTVGATAGINFLF